MAAIRALFIAVTLAAFFLIGTPLQWLIRRYAPAAEHAIPLFFCRLLLRLLKVRVVANGARVIDRPVLVVANHISWIDILALGSIAPFCFLAKSEIAGWPILSAFAEVQGTVFVDRRRRRTVLRANRNMAARMLQGRAGLLFPEGTTRDTPEPGAFRTSHFAAARDLLRSDPSHERVDIQPVAVSYSARHAAWIGDDGLVPHLWRTLRAPPLRCNVSFGAPIPYLPESDRKLVAKAARASIVGLLGSERAEEPDAEVTADMDPLIAVGTQ